MDIKILFLLLRIGRNYNETVDNRQQETAATLGAYNEERRLEGFNTHMILKAKEAEENHVQLI